MPHKVRIALDAMGGDHGAAVVVPGAELSLSRHPDIEFFLFGDRAAVEPLLDARPQLKAASRVVHTDIVVQMHKGQIRLESEEGQYAEFVVTLPRDGG